MRKMIMAVAVLLSGFIQSAMAETYKVDPVHSSVVFRVLHQQVSFVYGRFNQVNGTFDYDPAAPEKATFNFEVETASIDTGVEKRDTHLKSPDFFDAAEYPVITFKSTSVKSASENTLEVTGDLTLHGTTKPITVTMKHTGIADGQRGKRAGFATEFTVKRSDFGMSFMIPGVSDEVQLMVGLQGGVQK